MAHFRVSSEKIGIIALGVVAGVMVSGMGGMALGQFAVAGIDPQLADTYRQLHAEQIAVEDHDLMGSVTPVSDDGFDSTIGASSRQQTIAYEQGASFAR